MSRENNYSFSAMVLALGMLLVLSTCEAFVPAHQSTIASRTTPSIKNMLPVSATADVSTLNSVHFIPSSLTETISSASPIDLSANTLPVAAATLDPTSVLSDVLGVFIGTPIILLVPILAALSVAAVLAWGIVSYANPEVEDDEI
jgi:hypothetical protein